LPALGRLVGENREEPFIIQSGVPSLVVDPFIKEQKSGCPESENLKKGS
jgi:hypothetical protein